MTFKPESRMSALVQFKPAWAALGNWRKLELLHNTALKRAIYRSAERAGLELKDKLRADVRKSGMVKAARLAGAVRGRMFPRRPETWRPAYVVGTNAPVVFDVQERGATISARRGGLLIPIGLARTLQKQLPIGTPHTALLSIIKARFGGQLASQRLRRTDELALGVFSALQGGRRRFVPLFLVRRNVTVPGGRLRTSAIIREAKGQFASRLANEVSALWEIELRKLGVRFAADGSIGL